MGFSRQEYWSRLPFPFPVGHILSDLSIWPVCLGWPHTAWLIFIELDRALVHVIRLASCLWLCFLWCPLSAPTILLGFLYLGCGVSPHSLCSWPWTWGISSWTLLLTVDVRYLLATTPVPRSLHSCYISPSLSAGVYSKAPVDAWNWIVPNPICTVFFTVYSYLW